MDLVTKLQQLLHLPGVLLVQLVEDGLLLFDLSLELLDEAIVLGAARSEKGLVRWVDLTYTALISWSFSPISVSRVATSWTFTRRLSTRGA